MRATSSPAYRHYNRQFDSEAAESSSTFGRLVDTDYNMMETVALKFPY